MALNQIDLPKIPSPKRSRKRHLLKAGKIALPILAAILLVTVGVGIWSFFQYRLVKADVDSLSARLSEFKKTVEREDIDGFKKQNGLLRGDLQKTKQDLARYSFVANIPIVAGYYNDAKHLLQAGLIGTEAADIGTAAVDPFADVLGLKGKKSNTNAQQKAEIVVRQVIPELVPKIDQLSVKLKQVTSEIDQVNPNHYPKNLKIKGFKIRESLLTAKKELAKAEALIPEVKPILAVLPAIAGEPTERNYLIIFQNDKELRPTGGFITSYARAKVSGGRLVNIVSGDIQDLDQKIPKKDPPPSFLSKYLKSTEWNIRDANVYPDYQLSAQKVEEFYYRIPKIARIDGVIAIDTEFVRRLLTITGPIKSKKLNQTFSADNNSLGIPDVVYKLELYTEKILANDPNHKGFIGELMNEVINKVSAFPPEKFEPFLTTVYQAAVEKHLLFYFDDKGAQKLAEKYNFAGRIKDYSFDYLHVNNSNFGGLKSNLFVKFKIDQDIQIVPDGTVTKTLTVTIKHTGKKDNWLSANYGNWQRVYVPSGSKLVSEKVPREYDFTTGEELDKAAFRTYYETMPLSSTRAVYVYQLPFKIKKGDKYHILMQKQPGDDSTTYTIRINGQLKKESKLTKDEEFEFNF